MRFLEWIEAAVRIVGMALMVWPCLPITLSRSTWAVLSSSATMWSVRIAVKFISYGCLTSLYWLLLAISHIDPHGPSVRSRQNPLPVTCVVLTPMPFKSDTMGFAIDYPYMQIPKGLFS